jgi:hypothetical protein
LHKLKALQRENGTWSRGEAGSDESMSQQIEGQGNMSMLRTEEEKR